MAMELALQRGTTSYKRSGIVLRDATTGKAKTGLVAADLTALYERGNAASVAIALSDLATFSDAYTSGGIKEDGATGQYRLDLPDAALATGADSATDVTIVISGAAILDKEIRIDLTDYVPDEVDPALADIEAQLAAGLTLTVGERTAIANEVEAQIIDETDSEKVLTAMTDKIASVNPSLSGLTLGAIAIAVRDVLNTAPAVNSLGAHVKAVADRTPGAGTLSTAADIAAAQTAITNAITALNNLSPAGAQAAVAAALAAYSAATSGNVGAVPAAVLAAAQTAPIHARIKIVNGTPIQGTGVAGDPMRPA